MLKVLLSAALLVGAENDSVTFVARVVGVSDGDTVTVLHEGRAVAVRLEGIDCPERGQDFSRRAKEFTSDLVFDREVQVIGKTRDRYGRLVARVMVGKRDVSVELVRAGLAWHFVRYSSDGELAKAELTAQARKAGLWAQGGQVPPWEYRTKGRPR